MMFHTFYDSGESYIIYLLIVTCALFLSLFVFPFLFPVLFFVLVLILVIFFVFVLFVVLFLFFSEQERFTPTRSSWRLLTKSRTPQ